MHWLPKDKESKFGSNFHLCLQRSSTDRLLSFESIATQTRIPVDKVEFLVMRALAKGLVKGSIDQVEQTVNLTWVQVRYWGYLNQGLFWPATPANCKFVFLDIFFFASQFEVVFLARSFRLFICLWRDSSCETLFWLLLFAYPSFSIGKHFIKMDSELSSTAENLSWFRKLLKKCDFFLFSASRSWQGPAEDLDGKDLRTQHIHSVHGKDDRKQCQWNHHRRLIHRNKKHPEFRFFALFSLIFLCYQLLLGK